MQSLRGQLFRGTFAPVIVSLIAIGIFASFVFRSITYEQSRQRLTILAQLFGDQLQNQRDSDPPLDKSCHHAGKLSQARITVIADNGIVICDSLTPTQDMDNHRLRPEIIEANRNTTGYAVRTSTTRNIDMMYIAISLTRNNRNYFVRTSMPMTAINDGIRRLFANAIAGGLLIAIILGLWSLLFSRRLAGEVGQLEIFANSIAKGEHLPTFPGSKTLELSHLGKSLNQMATHLQDRLATIARQVDELNAVLAAMSDGLLAFDRDGKLLKTNPVACCQLGIDGSLGISHTSLFSDSALSDVVTRCLTEDQPRHTEVVIGDLQEVNLIVHGSPLNDHHGHRFGTLIVLTDTTQIRKLEQLRSEFVANVSHELRTPITNIKGYVETLLEGALKDEQQNINFLAIVAKNALRLESIINDLLSLSRLENQSEGVKMTLCSLHTIVTEAVETCTVAATRRHIEIHINCPKALRLPLNPSFFQQALVNLINNAIHYSDEKTRITVSAQSTKHTIIISVSDQGVGIAAEHIGRLFERFYRIDKDRSRQKGGTGLGLSIVKHIARLHGGDVEVNSRPGTGSTFTITLPKP